MKQLKEIKNKLIKNDLWKEYSQKFTHKQMKLISTKIALIFNKNIKVQDFYEIEKELIVVKKNKFMFLETFNKISYKTNYSCDWKSFSIFLWYIYQTSTYYKDKKKKIDNIFIDNTIKMNQEKRKYFYLFMNSLDMRDDYFNDKIISILKLTF